MTMHLSVLAALHVLFPSLGMAVLGATPARKIGDMDTMASAITLTATTPEACPMTASMPYCAFPCLASAATIAGCSDMFDVECQCKNRNSDEAELLKSGCVVSSCGSWTAKIVESVGAAICDECVKATATATAPFAP
ncbi:hypothetical protein N656DRAFT_801730 [Canariomyces notabilis]|uniref:CFEM domain-containing protein n=1 Tax=Canariomyces notabilis TaxID=2074819 RepID=A0AAN6T8V9_9PEZI|nr:hypothetical protein N656DRAFT_801730 [Canariomyces arenarius]